MHRSIALAFGFVAASLTFVPLGTAQAAGAKPFATYDRGVLTVHGSSASERIVVREKATGLVVKVNGRKVAVPKCDRKPKCHEVRVIGLAGDDRSRVAAPVSSGTRFVLIGGKGDDVLTGTPAGMGESDPETFDLLDGGQGDDILEPNGGTDVLDGGSGDDTYLVDADEAGQANVREEGGKSRSHLTFAPTRSKGITYVNETVPGEDLGMAYTNTYSPSGYPYTLLFTSGTFTDLTGGAGNDQLYGHTGLERMHGGPGNDLLSPFSPAQDEVMVAAGDSGNDTFMVCTTCGDGAVKLEDASGADTVYTGSLSASNEFRLDTAARQGIVQLSSAATFENLVGSQTDDTLTGNGLDNFLAGQEGDDTLVGGGGADTFLVGRVFAYYEPSWGDDTVEDFTPGVDTVQLEAGLSVKSGLGTTAVTIWDGVNDRGTVTAGNGHFWQQADFS